MNVVVFVVVVVVVVVVVPFKRLRMVFRCAMLLLYVAAQGVSLVQSMLEVVSTVERVVFALTPFFHPPYRIHQTLSHHSTYNLLYHTTLHLSCTHIISPSLPCQVRHYWPLEGHTTPV